jgi:Exostosin family
MTIYVLPVHPHLQPKSQPFVYPKHSTDYGVEQDFHAFLENNRHLVVENPHEAAWHYLPVYWTRWHLCHDYGKFGRGELQTHVDRAILDDTKTFTICQYDDGPLADIGKTTQFLAARKTSVGVDIPVLTTPHKLPFFIPRKRYHASFVGRLRTHPIRAEVARVLSGRPDVFIYDGVKSSRYFVRKTLASWIALAPRGYGGSSFRFFEAMQLGVVPLFVGDVDTRPFKHFIAWDSCSFYVSRAAEVLRILEKVSYEVLETMGQRAQDVYLNSLAFGRWCDLVVKELEMRATPVAENSDV